MNIEQRRCANCCAYEDGECMNGIGRVNARDRCDAHQTEAELDAWFVAVTAIRTARGLPPRQFGAQDDNDGGVLA